MEVVGHRVTNSFEFGDVFDRRVEVLALRRVILEPLPYQRSRTSSRSGSCALMDLRAAGGDVCEELFGG